MSVLDRSALVDSPLADLHAIASELTIDGYRRLRREELIDAIIEKQGGEVAPAEPDGEPSAEEPTPSTRRRRSRRGGRSSTGDAADAESDDAPEAESEAETESPEETPVPRRSRSRARKPEPEPETETEPETESAAPAPEPAEEERPARSRRGARSRSSEEAPERASSARGSSGRASSERASSERAPSERGASPDRGASSEEEVEGPVEVLPNGSGFVRLGGAPEDDVYISSAQVKRCELVSGDTVAGPKRAPRRSERFASLIRIETINGRPASEQADTVRFDDLPATLPSELIDLAAADATLKAVQALAPLGRGSRVTITGASRSGKSELLRRIAAGLADRSELTVSVALAGVRPEEIGTWSAEGEGTLPAPAAALSFAASEDARAGVLEPVVDQARRLAARGSHAVVLIDTLDGLSPHSAHKLMASARAVSGGGSVTIIATASAPVGGETTVIALDLAAASTGRFPALDALGSGTLRPELLVGETAAKKIARDRAKALKD
jgi:transcription termination factor Rho